MNSSGSRWTGWRVPRRRAAVTVSNLLVQHSMAEGTYWISITRCLAVKFHHSIWPSSSQIHKSQSATTNTCEKNVEWKEIKKQRKTRNIYEFEGYYRRLIICKLIFTSLLLKPISLASINSWPRFCLVSTAWTQREIDKSIRCANLHTHCWGQIMSTSSHLS